MSAGGAFDGITIPRARLVSQIIDNLNKAAAVGFPPDEIAARLKSAWSGESARLRIYDQVQAVALAFRRTCLEENLLDWSLQIEVFWQHLLPLPQFRRYLLGGYRHLIVDNTEEDIPAAHDLLRVWLPLCESALVVHDTDGGYRVFLGADPTGRPGPGHASAASSVVLPKSHVTTPRWRRWARAWPTPWYSAGEAPGPAVAPAPSEGRGCGQGPRPGGAAGPDRFHPRRCRFHPQMLDWVAEQVSRLVHGGGHAAGRDCHPGPFSQRRPAFLSDRKADPATTSPSAPTAPRANLREEPAARCLLTLAKLAHPAWRRPPPAADVAHAFAAVHRPTWTRCAPAC